MGRQEARQKARLRPSIAAMGYERGLAEHMVMAAAIVARCPPEIIRGKVREPRIVRARDAAIWALRNAGWSLPRIGRAFGNRDHSTIHSAVARAEARRAARRNNGHE